MKHSDFPVRYVKVYQRVIPFFDGFSHDFPRSPMVIPMVSPEIHRNSRAASPLASPGPPHFLAKGWSKAWQDRGRPQMRRRHGESMGNPRKKHAKIMGKLTRNGKKHWNYHWETHQTWWIYPESESVGFIIWYMWTKNDGKTNCHPMSSHKMMAKSPSIWWRMIWPDCISFNDDGPLL